ncbi:MAG: divalent cation tolerance protein CutA [Gammaproteobacteria bacterium]
MLIKTTAACFEALRERIRVLHPYQVPEIIATPITHADPAYLNWLIENTRTP